MPHSHHSHSGQFCKHAVGRLEDVVLEAIRQEFQVYGLTEHVPRYRMDDLYPEEKGLPLDALMQQFEGFLDEAHRLKAAYEGQITLLVGLETEHITEADLAGLERLLQRFGDKIEYIVGSVHHVGATPIDFDRPTYETALQAFPDRAAFYEAYFDDQYRMLERFKPEVVGHIDLCRLYEPTVRFTEIPRVWEKIARNVRYAVEYGALFEVNAAAFRKGWEAAYPGSDILKLILDCGGRLALSDDSHGPHAVGLNYHRTFDYLKASGVEELWYLTRSQQENPAGRRTQAVRLEGSWQEHSFWRSKK